VSPSVRAVERALDILLCFTTEEPVQSLSRIAESVRLSKPTVHRLLATLEKKQFIAKNQATSQYCLGIHGQYGCFGTRVQSSGKILKNESGETRILNMDTPGGRNSMVAYVAASIPKDPQVTTGFTRAGTSH
jgi:hypothetical protein